MDGMAHPRLTLKSPKGTLTYHRAGTGPAILLMHGLGGNADTWALQMADLADRFDVIAWDAPGFGSSDVRGSDQTDFADAALELLDGLGIAKATVVGHSMGGLIAMTMADSAPGKVAAMVLSSPAQGHGHPKGAPLSDGYRKRVDLMQTMPKEEFGRARAMSMTADGTSEAVIEQLAAIAAEARPDGFETACRMLNEGRSDHLAPRITCPALVISAGLDRVISPESTADLATRIPGARHEHIPNVGHAAYREAPETMTRLILEAAAQA